MCSPRNINGVVIRGQFDVRPESFLNPGGFPERSSTLVREGQGKTDVPGAQGFTRSTTRQVAQATEANVSRIKSTLIPNAIVVLHITTNMQARKWPKTNQTR